MTPDEAVGAARKLVPGLAARAAGYDAGAAFPAEDFTELARAGLLGLMVPPRLGGAGASFAGYAEVAMTLAAGSPATALIYNMHASITGALALTPDDLARELGAPAGFFAMRDRVLRAAADGALYAVAMSERGIGSRLSQVRTSYRPVPGGWQIRGEKAFCSGAGHADGYLVAARRAADADPGTGADPGTDAGTGADADADRAAPPEPADPGAPPQPTVSYFLIPAGPGITVRETWDPLGMRASASNDLLLDVTVPSDALLGGAEGLVLLLAQVMPQWLVASYAAVYAGIAQTAVDAAAAELRARGLGGMPAVRARLGRADAQAAAAREVVRQAARHVDEEPGTGETSRWIWRAKLVAGDTAQQVASSALEACGTSATRRGHPLERLYRDARCGALQPATSDVCADWLGCAVLGLDPDAETPRW